MFVAAAQNLTTQLSAVLGFIARHGSEAALPVSPLGSILCCDTLRCGLMRLSKPRGKLIGRFPQSTSLAKINRWTLKLAVFRRSNLPIESLPKAQEMPRLGEKAQV